MNFVDGLGRAQRTAFGALLHPLLIVPLVAQIPNDRGSAWWLFTPEADRIRLVHTITVAVGLDVKFIEIPGLGTWDEALPNAGGFAGVEPVGLGVPTVKAADH